MKTFIDGKPGWTNGIQNVPECLRALPAYAHLNAALPLSQKHEYCVPEPAPPAGKVKVQKRKRDDDDDEEEEDARAMRAAIPAPEPPIVADLMHPELLTGELNIINENQRKLRRAAETLEKSRHNIEQETTRITTTTNSIPVLKRCVEQEEASARRKDAYIELGRRISDWLNSAERRSGSDCYRLKTADDVEAVFQRFTELWELGHEYQVGACWTNGIMSVQNLVEPMGTMRRIGEQ